MFFANNPHDMWSQAAWPELTSAGEYQFYIGVKSTRIHRVGIQCSTVKSVPVLVFLSKILLRLCQYLANPWSTMLPGDIMSWRWSFLDLHELKIVENNGIAVKTLGWEKARKNFRIIVWPLDYTLYAILQ